MLREKKVVASSVTWPSNAETVALPTGVFVPVMVTRPEMVTPVSGPGSAGKLGLNVVFVVNVPGTGTAAEKKNAGGAGEGRICTDAPSLTAYVSPVGKVNEYPPVEARLSLPEDVVCGGGAEVSITDNTELGIVALPEMLTVPERVAVVMVGALKLKGLVTAADPRLVMSCEIVVKDGGTNDEACCNSCTMNVPFGS